MRMWTGMELQLLNSSRLRYTTLSLVGIAQTLHVQAIGRQATRMSLGLYQSLICAEEIT